MKQTQPRITKRHRKHLRGPNYAASMSLKNGKSRIVLGDHYRGSEPKFMAVTDPSTGMVLRYQRVKAGIPYVRPE